jgi:hypothetical protein
MPVIWNLREWLRERGITRASHVSRIVRERTGYVLSTQAVCDLLNDQPKMLRLETSQALCDAFYCRLRDFFEVMHRAVSRPHVKTPRLFEATSSRDNSIIETEQGARDNERKDQGMSRENSNVDFAAFFPNARKFSS